MNDETHLFYKERELSNVKENICFKLDKNLKKELVKHFKGKYGENGLTIGMNKMVEDYMNDTPLIRCNLPIVISLALPKNPQGIFSLILVDFERIKSNDKKKDKLKILRISKYKGIEDVVFKESVPFDQMNTPNIWNIVGFDNTFGDFKERLNLTDIESENIKEIFNESISPKYKKFYNINDVYIVHYLLNNFLDTESDGSYGNDGKHYGAFSLKT